MDKKRITDIENPMVFLKMGLLIFDKGKQCDDDKGNSPAKSPDGKDNRFQGPIKKLVDIGHALAYPIKGRLKDVQWLIPSINHEQDQGGSGNQELQTATNFYPHKLAQ